MGKGYGRGDGPSPLGQHCSDMRCAASGGWWGWGSLFYGVGSDGRVEGREGFPPGQPVPRGAVCWLGPRGPSPGVEKGRS